jgi:hypothetical protein
MIFLIPENKWGAALLKIDSLFRGLDKETKLSNIEKLDRVWEIFSQSFLPIIQWARAKSNPISEEEVKEALDLYAKKSF